MSWCLTGELSVGPLVTRDERERVRRTAQVQQAEADFEPIALDAAAARAFGQVAASLRRSSRKRAARAYDRGGAYVRHASRWGLRAVNAKKGALRRDE